MTALHHGWSLLLMMVLSFFAPMATAADDAQGDAGAGTGTGKIPGTEQLRQMIPRGHPRIWFRPGDFERLRERLDDPDIAPAYQALLKDVEARISQPVPKIVIPPGFYKTYFPENEQLLHKNYAIIGPAEQLSIGVQRLALAYRLTGDDRYLQQARQGLAELADIDLEESSYTLTHAFHPVISGLAVGLDYLWDQLEAEEKERITAALLARAREFHPLAVGVALRNPLNSHAIHYGPNRMLDAALALYHHQPEAEAWMQDLLTFVDRFPGQQGYGGSDGGWGQGLGYIGSHQFQFHAQRIFVGTGVNLFENPWSRRNGYFFLYFQPPGSRCPGFADSGGELAFFNDRRLFKMIMQTYARVHRNPHYQWYADQIPGSVIPAGTHPWITAAMSFPLYWPEMHAQPPDDLPLAVHLRDIDWVAMHTRLVDRERNIMLQFKSNRAFGHNHKDQNSFILDAFGHPLLIDSGYYPWWGSPHHEKWTRRTLAHNALLIDGKGQDWGDSHITAFSSNTDFCYTAGDATQVYREGGAAAGKVVRHIVQAHPDIFVILDEVQTDDPAGIQFLLHALEAFKIDEDRRVVSIVHGPARADVHFLEAGPVHFSQTGQFTVPRELSHAGDQRHYPKQWHLTADFAKTESVRRLLTVIRVRRSDDQSRQPPIARLEEPGMLGVKIGATTVVFRVDMGDVAVTCRGLRPDGTRTSLEYSR